MNGEQWKVQQLDRRAMHADRLYNVLKDVAPDAGVDGVELCEVDGWSARVAVDAAVDSTLRVLEAEPDTADVDASWTVRDQYGNPVCSISIADGDNTPIAAALTDYLSSSVTSLSSAKRAPQS